MVVQHIVKLLLSETMQVMQEAGIAFRVTQKQHVIKLWMYDSDTSHAVGSVALL